jgi:hypothetical protein
MTDSYYTRLARSVLSDAEQKLISAQNYLALGGFREDDSCRRFQWERAKRLISGTRNLIDALGLLIDKDEES